jgi:hypothetical protein
MKKNNDIDSFLRENKPKVKENTAFLLEVQQKMRAVDGIKTEVDRQRNHYRIILVLTMATGLVMCASAISLAYLHPLNLDILSNGFISEISIFLDTWKHYLLLPIAACATGLGLIFSRQTY